ncbi:LytR C-terminal domain-containing protein [Acaricomes phytoseiuli]|uniref:LytR C-terminal domain-containing protein n=1 Tax=Acaricomes phytoseiuli TaxID=291968 RepID=UPI0003A7AFCF|nr:LytR C-terminal domain-containing protein [Acaricomes phytoseiuli]
MSNYPRDEFDNIPESSSRQGAHRTAMAQPRGGLIPTIGFAVIALLVGAGLFFLVPRLTDGETLAVSSASSAAPTASTASPSRTAATASPKPTSASTASPKPSESPVPPAPTTPPAPVVDRSQPVAVYNASGVSGLAAGVAGQLRSQGWTVPTTGNWRGSPQNASVVLYQSEQLKANADEIAASLRISSVVLSPQVASPVLVVLGPGAG